MVDPFTVRQIRATSTCPPAVPSDVRNVRTAYRKLSREQPSARRRNNFPLSAEAEAVFRAYKLLLPLNLRPGQTEGIFQRSLQTPKTLPMFASVSPVIKQQLTARFAGLRLAVALAAASVSLQASASLLAGHEAQLEAWLGTSGVTFTPLFTKVDGDGKGTLDFHAAVDGKGPTFSLLTAYNFHNHFTGTSSDLGPQLLGGFNQLSWSDDGFGFVVTPTDAERTAFIFNLTTGTIHRQNLIGEGDTNSGVYHSQNESVYGPAFGMGQDLLVGGLLNTGGAYNYSYGGTSYAANITGTGNTLDFFQVSALEVYAIGPVPPTGPSVPDTSNPFLPTLLSLTALVGLARKLR